MRRIHRGALSQATLDRLAALTTKVMEDPAPVAKAKAQWRSKPKVAFKEVRAQLEAMASGRARCMYCEDSLGTDIDHFRPKAIFPELAFDWSNFLLACSHCNSNLKRDEFPVNVAGDSLLIDPSADDPDRHLVFTPSTGAFVSIDTKGRESIRVFGLNDDSRPRRLMTGRKQALVGLVALLKDYDREVAANPAKASEIRTTVTDHPFSAVLHWLVCIAHEPSGDSVLGTDVVSLVQRHQVNAWL